ncbi:ABC transporter substrate-binding protein [Nocardia otitidiscaviarum]|uniref:ABC transporter substrate-binding protein n=1 Tax=Nocardia otitidiscaviarum TaxID=1823 RepID=UPI0004A6BCFE|nr:ABC transporter substrate-binding protein [Nocardia otitidiscaviarum]MBF6136229.1 ABC transporter substrate-binding protein [Nocardia otitidiscaviarum]MBF6484431.1 ABC transporter substrate-binding protein [Nocardia otitidiscaviarum]
MMRTPRTRFAALLLGAVSLATALAACGSDADPDTVAVNIGYQSKTINTVTAGTLLRELGLLESKLAEIGASNGKTYEVSWHDFASGPPLTAEMIAGKVHIGSMGDYPLSVNGAKTAELPDVATRWVSTTGYNLRGSLNQVVVPLSSTAEDIEDLRGQVVSTSLGSTAHGNFVSALDAAGMSTEDVRLLGQDPPVGVTALETAQVAALAQFVPFPQRVIFAGQGRLLHDGNTGVPTFHGVVANERYTSANPEVLTAFLEAQREATEYLYDNPLEAAVRVADATGLPPEVVYLYNGPNGVVTFDLTIKPELIAAVETGLPFLKELGALEDLDLASFVDTGALEQLYGGEYDSATASLANPAAITGADAVCGLPVDDPATASEAWPADADHTSVAATPTCLLRLVAAGGEFRALYVPDAGSGTRIFGQYASWVLDPAAAPEQRLLPFGAIGDARAYAAAHPGTTVLDYQAALAATASD